jgi:ketosteroid isomerase-like protein
MAHPNEELIRKGYESFAVGDMAALSELLADDIIWHTPGRNQLAGTLHGKEELFDYLKKFVELTGGTFKLEIHTVLADDEHVVVLARATGEREGRTLDDNGVQVFHAKNGKITEQWLYPGDVYAGDEFWG